MEWSTVAALISAVISLISLVFSTLANLRQKRSDANEMYRMLMDKWLSDEDIYKFINMVEYDDFEYGRDFHNASTEIERIADKALMFFNQVCYLERNGSLPIEHIGSFNYQIEGLMKNDDVKDYLYNIYHWSKKEQRDCPYLELIGYAKKHNLLDGQFEDKDLSEKDNKYHNYLDFRD